MAFLEYPHQDALAMYTFGVSGAGATVEGVVAAVVALLATTAAGCAPFTFAAATTPTMDLQFWPCSCGCTAAAAAASATCGTSGLPLTSDT